RQAHQRGGGWVTHQGTSGTMTPAGAWIGRPIKRREDLRFLRGRARYVDDIVFPRMAHLAVVRSAHAHARLRGVRVAAARRSPGVIAVVTAQDLVGRIHPMPITVPEGDHVAQAPHPVLATEKVRYAGEPVAAVLAETRAAAVDGAALIEVDY